MPIKIGCHYQLAVLTTTPKEPGAIRKALETHYQGNTAFDLDREEERLAALKWVLLISYYLPHDVAEQHKANVLAALDAQWC